MIIHECGEIILCRNIIFEDKKIDMELGHPGIVLLPTSENDEVMHCLYMTSDDRRALEEKEKYTYNTGKAEKQSYINIQQIVKRANVKDASFTRLSNKQFKALLKKFYDYQMSLLPQRPEFLEIKRKIETLLSILGFNKEFGIDKPISRKEVDTLETVTDEKKKRKVYCGYLLITGIDLEEQFFSSKKDRIYFETLTKAFNKLKNVNFDKLDFNNPNNEIRQIYTSLRSSNYLINIDILFDEVASIFCMMSDEGDKKGDLIKEFLHFERSREIAKAKAKEEKSLMKKEQNKQNRQDFYNKQEQKRRNRQISKYGKFDIDFFGD